MLAEPSVRAERTGWRDLALSARHRLWGFDAPCVDIDWLVTEYDHCQPVAGVEYKHERRPLVEPFDANIAAFVALFDRARLPAFRCRYAGDLAWFEVSPLNERAHGSTPVDRRLDELGWVRFIYGLRGRTIPTSVVDALERAPGAAFAAQFPRYGEVPLNGCVDCGRHPLNGSRYRCSACVEAQHRSMERQQIARAAGLIPSTFPWR